MINPFRVPAAKRKARRAAVALADAIDAFYDQPFLVQLGARAALSKVQNGPLYVTQAERLEAHVALQNLGHPATAFDPATEIRATYYGRPVRVDDDRAAEQALAAAGRPLRLAAPYVPQEDTP